MHAKTKWRWRSDFQRKLCLLAMKADWLGNNLLPASTFGYGSGGGIALVRSEKYRHQDPKAVVART